MKFLTLPKEISHFLQGQSFFFSFPFTHFSLPPKFSWGFYFHCSTFRFKFPFENNYVCSYPLGAGSDIPHLSHESALLWNVSQRWRTSNASQDGGGRDIKLHTSGIFLTGLTRPESKMKLRKMKGDLADKADDRQGEPVKGNWPMARGELAKLCETPCWKTINLGLSVWRIGPQRQIIFACGRCLPGSCTSGGAFGKVDRVWMGAQH